MTCRDCRYLAVPLDKIGRRVARKSNMYRCLAPFPPLPAIPDSFTSAWDWERYWPPKPRHMQPDDGANCPTWTARQTP